MSTRDTEQLRRLKASGNDEAALILELLEAASHMPEHVDGMTFAMGIDPDVDDILNSITEDMMGELLPILLKMSGAWALPQSGGFESLRWQLSIVQMLDIAIFNHKRWHQGKEPMYVALSTQWKQALDGATTYDYHGTIIYLRYMKRWSTTKLVCTPEDEEQNDA